MQWSYAVLTLEPDEAPSDLQRKLDVFGSEGWELVTSHSAGNQMWFVFKKAGAGMEPPTTVGSVAY